MKFVLVIILALGYTGGVATSNFSTKEKCEAAKKEVEKKWGVSAYCFEK